MMSTKRYPLDIRIDQRIIEESKKIEGKTNIPMDIGISFLPNFIQYPYTNEDSDKLKRAFSIKGKDQKPFIRDKKSMLFIVGGGAILGSFNDIFANNQLERIVGIDLSAAQLYNLKHLAERSALEEKRGRESFLRRAPRSTNTTVNSIRVLPEWQDISEKIFGYPLTIEPANEARSYFSIPAKGLYDRKHRIELVKEDIVDYLKRVEAYEAPDLVYISNLSEWGGGSISNAISDVIRSNDKFPIGTTMVGVKLSVVTISVKAVKDGKPVIDTYKLSKRS
ncbi:hypothetical protein B2A_00152 [mine drainage metagenome]|uniref:Uncharacterized protein n=1 Tax=mine drainage metagenome TaxID=410659 RepID=T1BL21_9ZZZZ